MLIGRRTFLAGTLAVVARPLHAEPAPPALAAYEAASGGRIGVHGENLVTGATLAWRADERFVMCSTFKASLAACVLSRVDAGTDRLDTMIRFGAGDLQPYAPVARQHLAAAALALGEMCRAAVELSDNTCANLLLAHIGGPAALTEFWRRIGDGVSRLDHDEPLLNRSPPGDPHDTTTPVAMAANLRRYVVGDALASASRARLIDWMVACKTGANRLRGGLPSGWRIGDKTGNNGADAMGDIALAWPTPDTPIVIAAYTQGGKPTPAQVTQVFAEIGRLVAQRLVWPRLSRSVVAAADQRMNTAEAAPATRPVMLAKVAGMTCPPRDRGPLGERRCRADNRCGSGCGAYQNDNRNVTHLYTFPKSLGRSDATIFRKMTAAMS